MQTNWIKIFTLILLCCSCAHKYNRNTAKKRTNPQLKVASHPTKNQKIPPTVATPQEEDELLVASSAVKVTPAVIRKYIADYKDIAMVEMQRYNIPASITLAQGILESGSGQSRLARSARNHFGIKCHVGWDGPSISHDDDAKGECFRKYRRAEDSFEDHSLFLVNRPRYASLFSLKSGDYKGWAYGLKKAGYATDPKYPSKLLFLIKKYDLHIYDQQVLGKDYAKHLPDAPTAAPKKEKSTQKAPTAQPRTVYVVQKGDTLYGISKKTGTSVEQLMKINGLPNANLSLGQELLIP